MTKNFMLSKKITLIFLIGISLSFAGTFTDPRDHQTYKTFSAGGRTWMAENLNYKSADSYCYNDSPSNCGSEGRLYTFNAAQKACPAGWSVPSEAEANAMIAEVDFRRDFRFVPAGLRSKDGKFLLRGANGYYWTSEGPNGKGKYFYATSDDVHAKWLTGLRVSALSVRCVQKSGAAESSSDGSSFRDGRDGNVYKTVKIGRQTWMAENLRYGKLGYYDQNSAMSACPAGWRLPSYKDFETLFKPGAKLVCEYDDEYGVEYDCKWPKGLNFVNQKGFAVKPSTFLEGDEEKMDAKTGSVFWTNSGYDEDGDFCCYSWKVILFDRNDALVDECLNTGAGCVERYRAQIRCIKQ